MNIILKIFLSMSFSGSLLILVLFVGKHFLENKISRQWQYYIWLIVIARLLLPFGPEANLMGKIYQTIDQTIVKTIPLAEQQSLVDVGVPYIPAADLEQNSQDIISPTNSLTANQLFQEIISLLTNHLWLIWLVVALILLIRKVTIYQSFIRYINAGLTPISDTDLLDKVSIIIEQIGVKRPVELCINPLVSSPLLIGFFHTCIVLPSADIPQKDFQYIVLHELTHYKRRDMFYKWLVQVTICLHWFNPIVYLLGREITKACEFSCDEAVLKELGYDNAQDYGKTLLDAMAAVGKYKESIAAVTLSENKQLLKERLGAIMKFKEQSKAVKILTVVLTLCVVLGASFVGIYTIDTAHAANLPNQQSDGDRELAFTQNRINAEDYAIYEQFGLVIDLETEKLYYDDKLVRCFDDQIPTDNFSVKAIGYYEKNGVIDVRTIRENINNTSKLVGLEVLSPTEFQERIITDPAESTLGENSNIFDVYAIYGLSYDETQNALFYNGKRVRLFWDSLNSELQPISTKNSSINNVSNWDADGVIDVYTIRDYEQKNENGYGELNGLRIATQEEFENNTENFSDSKAIETAN